MQAGRSGAHWEIADRAAEAAGVVLGPLSTLEDADRIVEVLVATWGGQEVTHEIFRALAESGNAPYGAFDDDELVGYVCGWLGWSEEELHVHSHMLAVLEPWRAKGVGYALKLAQRADAIDRGVRVVRWTFDPLIARNAHFNFRKLGVLADRFERNFYGEMTDVLNRGDRSDRLVARWELDREPGARPAPGGERRTLVGITGPADRPQPVWSDADLAPDAGGSWAVHVPWDHAALRERDHGLATAWRDAVGDALELGLGLGLIAAAFETDADACEARYLLAAPGEGS